MNVSNIRIIIIKNLKFYPEYFNTDEWKSLLIGLK